MFKKYSIMAALIAISCLPLLGNSDKPLLIRNGRIVPVVGAVISKGSLLIENGKIARIGTAISAPAGAEIVDAQGMSVYPGMISSLTTIGVIRHPGAGDDLNEVGTSTAQADPFEALNPEDDSIEVARIGGVTSVLTISGTRNVINGKSIVINLDGNLASDMIVRRSAAEIFSLVVRSRDKYPSTEPGVMAFIRDRFNEAGRYQEMKKRSAGEGRPESTSVNLELEALLPVLSGEVRALFLTRDELTVRNAIELINEFKLKGIIFARAGILKFADELAKQKIPVIWAGALTGPQPREPYDINYRTAGILARKGVLFSIEKIVGEPDGRNSPRNLPVPASMSVAHGLSEEEAIKALTINPAKILGVDAELGSLEAGKLANIVIWTGSPIQLRSRVKGVIINGKIMPLESIQTRLRDKFERIVRERMAKDKGT